MEQKKKRNKKIRATQLTLLQQHNASKPIIQIPKIDGADAALVVQLPVDIEGLVGADLHAADLLGGRVRGAAAAAAAAARERRVELVAPRRPVAVAVAVVVAEEVLAPRLPAPAHGERLVDRREQVLG